MLYRFADFELDTERHTLHRSGHRIEVEPKALELLALLIEHRDRIVEKDEILATLWPGVSIGPNSINQAVYVLRKALADDSRNPRYLHVTRGRGLRFIGEVRRGRWEWRRVSGLVGRRSELAVLTELVDSAISGVGRMLVLCGEAGIGKTALVGALASKNRSRLQVQIVRCSEVPGAPDLWPLLQAVQSLQGDASRGIIPTTDHYLAGGEFRNRELAAIDVESVQFDRYVAIARELAQFASSTPLLLVVEDAHLADSATAAFLLFASAELESLPLSVLVTTRPSGLTSGPLKNFAARSGVDLLTLAGLPEHEVLEFARSGGRVVSEEELRVLMKLTDGSPFLVGNLMRSGMLFESIDGSDPSLLSVAVRNAVLSDLDHLAAEELQMVEAAAVVGSDFDLSELARGLGLRKAEVDCRLRSAMELGILRRTSSRSDELVFRHALLRDAIYSSIHGARRQSYHSKFATAGLVRRDNDPGSVLRALKHCARAKSVPSPEQWVPVAAAAIRDASRLGAYADALNVAREALSLSESQGLRGRDQLDVLLSVGQAEALLGDRRAGRALLSRAAQLAGGADDRRSLAAAALSVSPSFFAIETGISDPAEIQLLERALGQVGPEECDLRVRLLGRLAMALYWSTGRERLQDLLAEAGRLAANCSVGSRAFLAGARCMSTWSVHNLEERRRLSREVSELARLAGEPDLELVGLVFSIATEMEKGDAGQVRELIAEFERRILSYRLSRAEWYVELFRGLDALNRGQLKSAEQSISRLSLQARRFHDANLAASLSLQMALLCWWRDEAHALRELMDDAIRRQPNLVSWRMARALILGESGGTGEARAELLALARDGFRGIPDDTVRVAGLAVAARVATDLRVEDAYSQLVSCLEPLAGRIAVIGYGVMTFGSIDSGLARIAAAVGDWERAEAFFASAQEIELRANCLAWFADSKIAHGLALQGRGRSRDAALARQQIDDGMRIAEELGLRRLIRIGRTAN